MSATPQYVGASGKPLVVTWTDDSPARLPQNLSLFSSVVVFFKSVTTGRKWQGAGTLTITDGPNGKLTYSFHPTTDLGQVDELDMQLRGTLTSNGQYIYSSVYHIPVLQPVGP